MWPSSRHPNYPEMGMLGLRDVFVVAPATSFHHTNNDPNLVSDMNIGVGVGVIPLLAAGPVNIGGVEDGDVINNRTRTTGIQLWQNQQMPHHHHHHHSNSNNNNYLKRNVIMEHHNNPSMNLLHSGGGSGVGGGSGSSTSATTCQDCGNQAKKDCSHHRCRTCCKSRGFDCATHVKSTWVPAARRRERQLLGAAAGSSGSTSSAKKQRLITSQTTTTSHTSTSNTTPPRSFDTSSSHQDASFKESLPGQVHAPAVFKCVRVTAVDDGEDEYAYQAVVKIGGHVFKGFLYDQGVENRDGFPNISELHLGGCSGSGGGGRNGASSSPILDPSEVYAAGPGGGLLGGSSYGNIQ